MSDDWGDCVHGNPIGRPCHGVCEHGVRCGEDCDPCERDYFKILDRLCDMAGEGDRKLGRRRCIDVLTELIEKDKRK